MTGTVDFATLLEFVEERMHMTSYYQPVIIRELVEADGEMARDELAKRVLLADDATVERAVKVLMRWPKQTLTKHGIVHYDRASKSFRLLGPTLSATERRRLVEACDRRLLDWNARVNPRMASARYAAIEAAGGRCQACGVLGSERPLDVDHVVPQSQSRNGRVAHPTLGSVPVDGEENLQVLCSACNRGKRDSGSYDFRPSEDRLIETIRLTLDLAERLGLDRDEVARHGTTRAA